MPRYGILTSITNTGIDSEVFASFAAPLNIISNTPAHVSDSISLKRLSASMNTQRWEIETAIAQTNPSTMPTNFFVHNVVNGYTGTFYIRMPQLYIPLNSRIPTNLTLTLNGNFAANSSTVNINGLSGYTLPKAEFITFAGDPKVYMVTAESTGTGIGIKPSLRIALGTGIAIQYAVKVTMLAKYDNSQAIGIKYRDGILVDPGTIKFIEDLQ